MDFVFILVFCIIFLCGYLIGSIPFGYLIGKHYGHDVRKEGSGNIGATNVTRVVGPRAGKCCFALDALKGFLPMLTLRMLSGHCFPEAMLGLCEIVLLVGTVAGHMFSVFLNFKGGKGIATAVGALAAITPLAAVSAFIVWVIVFKLSGYVSLGSIVAAVAFPVLAWLFSILNLPQLSGSMLIFFVFLALVAIWKHQSNIRRLLQGTENRFEKHSFQK